MTTVASCPVPAQPDGKLATPAEPAQTAKF